MTMARESVSDAAIHLLWAIDRGYFMDALLPSSAYVEALRQAVEAETGKSAFPQAAETPGPVLSARAEWANALIAAE